MCVCEFGEFLLEERGGGAWKLGIFIFSGAKSSFPPPKNQAPPKKKIQKIKATLLFMSNIIWHLKCNNLVLE